MKKINLKTVTESLSRDEMRIISGGSGNCKRCTTNSNCSSGVCANWGGDCSGPCGCGKFCL